MPENLFLLSSSELPTIPLNTELFCIWQWNGIDTGLSLSHNSELSWTPIYLRRKLTFASIEFVEPTYNLIIHNALTTTAYWLHSLNRVVVYEWHSIVCCVKTCSIQKIQSTSILFQIIGSKAIQTIWTNYFLKTILSYVFTSAW